MPSTEAQPPAGSEPAGGSPSRLGDCIALACLLAATLFFCAPFLENLKFLADDPDWHIQATLHASVRRTLLEFQQFPFRSPFVGGGFPTFGHPEDPTLSPFIVPTLLFGEVIGIKVSALILHLVCAFGMYYLTRGVLGFSRLGSAYSALLLTTSSGIAAKTVGNFNEMQYALFPLLLGLLLRATGRGQSAQPSPRALVAAALVFFVVLTTGKFLFPAMALYLLVFACLDAVSANQRTGESANERIGESRSSPIRVFTCSPICLFPAVRFDLSLLRTTLLLLALTALLGLAKLVPTWDVLTGHGSLYEIDLHTHQKGYTPGGIAACSLPDFLSLLVNVWPVPTWTVTADQAEAPSLSVWRLAVAIPALLIFLVAAALTLRQSWKFLAVGLVFLWLCMAHEAPFDLFRVLWCFPVFHTMDNPPKYFEFFVAFTVCLVSGGLFSRLHAWLGHGAYDFVAALLLIAGLAPGLFLNREAHSGYFKMDPKPARGKGLFFQVRGVGMKRHHARPAQANMYLNLLSNVGTIDWSATVAGYEFAEPKFFVDAKGREFRNSQYRGEIYFADASQANEAGVGKVRPNSILANVNVKQPGRLIINQNFHPAWRCDDGPVVNHNGLLAVDRVNTGAYTVLLRYEPLASYFGLVVSALTLLALVLLAWLRTHLLAWTCAPIGTLTLGLPQAALVAILALIVCTVFWFVKLRHEVAADYLFDYGNACTERKNVDEAIKAFKKVIELKRDHPLVYRELGLCYAVKNRWAEAISQFRKGLEVSPGDTGLRNLLSSAYCSVERYEDAAREAQAALDREPFNGRAHVNLALCHALDGRRDQALAALGRAIEVGFTDHAYLERQPALKDILADESIALLIAQRRGSLLR